MSALEINLDTVELKPTLRDFLLQSAKLFNLKL